MIVDTHGVEVRRVALPEERLDAIDDPDPVVAQDCRQAIMARIALDLSSDDFLVAGKNDCDEGTAPAVSRLFGKAQALEKFGQIRAGLRTSVLDAERPTQRRKQLLPDRA